MNRKNTILIAVLVNAGLLAVLLIAALTTQEDPLPSPSMMAEAPLLPKFDEPPLFRAALPLREEIVLADPIQVVAPSHEPEPIVHQLPPLLPEQTLAAVPMAVTPPAISSEWTVKKGDTLEKIAKAHQTTVDGLIKLNHLTNSFLKVGQVLKIPTEKVLAKVLPEKKSGPTGPEYYTMKVGDNPWAIAMKHHMKVEELLRLNGLNEERARKLKPGDRLRIR